MLSNGEMPTVAKELVEKNNAVIRMNKTKAYRELQRRQGRALHRVLSEASSATQSYDFSVRQQHILAKSMAIQRQQNHNMLVDSGSTQGALFTKRYLGASVLTINLTKNDSSQRPLSRARMGSSRARLLYTEPGRPITAPEANAYATLDGPRQEMIPFYPKANSVHSNKSDLDSLNEFENKRHISGNRRLRHSIDVAQSIDCNSNAPLKPHSQNEAVGETIQYPAASKMRQMLANDGRIPLEKPLVNASGSQSIMRQGSHTSFTTKMPGLSQTPATADSRVSKPPINTQQQSATTPTISVRVPKSNTFSIINRKTTQGKQVSFVEGGSQQAEMIASRNITKPSAGENQPLALTAKNLNTYNAMVLKTLRTSKFDERIVQWVKERQCDRRTGIPKHDIIPEVSETDEASCRESEMSAPGRLTPNKRDCRGSTTPTDNEKSAPATSSKNIRSQNIIINTTLSSPEDTTKKTGVTFCYNTNNSKNTPHTSRIKEEENLTEDMSVKTTSDPRQSKDQSAS